MYRKTIYPNIPQAVSVSSIARIEKNNNNYFTVGYRFEDKQNSNSNIVIYTNNYNFILDSLLVTLGTGQVRVDIYENSTVTNNGIEVPSYCLNRIFPAIADANIFISNNISNVGTNIFNYDSRPNAIDINTIIAGTILKSNSIYLFKLQHIGNQSTNVHFLVSWTE